MGKFNGREGYEITLSAPDSAWLKQNVQEFRRWPDLFRDPIKRPVSSLVLLPVGAGAEESAHTIVAENDAKNARFRFHLVFPTDWTSGSLRTEMCDEVVLIDRSSPPSPKSPTFPRSRKIHCAGRYRSMARTKRARTKWGALVGVFFSPPLPPPPLPTLCAVFPTRAAFRPTFLLSVAHAICEVCAVLRLPPFKTIKSARIR